jgi:hypothetical protein
MRPRQARQSLRQSTTPRMFALSAFPECCAHRGIYVWQRTDRESTCAYTNASPLETLRPRASRHGQRKQVSWTWLPTVLVGLLGAALFSVLSGKK